MKCKSYPEKAWRFYLALSLQDKIIDDVYLSFYIQLRVLFNVKCPSWVSFRFKLYELVDFGMKSVTKLIKTTKKCQWNVTFSKSIYKLYPHLSPRLILYYCFQNLLVSKYWQVQTVWMIWFFDNHNCLYSYRYWWGMSMILYVRILQYLSIQGYSTISGKKWQFCE